MGGKRFLGRLKVFHVRDGVLVMEKGMPQTDARLPHSALLRFTATHNMRGSRKLAMMDSPFMTVHSRIDIETPCVKVCVLDPDSGYCIGCGRTRSEIAGWLDMTDDGKRAVLAALPLRRTDAPAATTERDRRR